MIFGLGICITSGVFNISPAIKIIEHCDKIYDKATPVDKHFYLMGAADCYYKQRESREDSLALAEKYHMLDIKLFPQYKGPLVKDMGGTLPSRK